MKTICLRFSDAYAPEEGTIQLHQSIINKCGYVWYGKKGCKINENVFVELLKNGSARILLVKSGSKERYWATVSGYSYEEKNEHPNYYKNEAPFMKTWIKITKIEPAPENILDNCYVYSTGTPMKNIIKKSMSPYFIVDVRE